jgi:RNA polymerase sigma-70 factor, ECF subfamily
MHHDELDIVLRENYPLIRAVCWRILQNDSDTDDATQNALISIARGFPTFDGRSAISTWIYRIATNAALDELRRRRRRRNRFVLTDRDPSQEIEDVRSRDSSSSIESRDGIDAALKLVPEEFRIPLVLRDVADLEYDEISSILNIPPGTVRSRISRGRARLADEWSKIDGNQKRSEERPTDGSDVQPRDSI